MVQVICYLETYLGTLDTLSIGNIQSIETIQSRLETKKYIRNSRLETMKYDWKHNLEFRNSRLWLKAQSLIFSSLFPIVFHCFQCVFFVSDIISLFKMYFFVSSRFFRCQSKLVPIYVSKLHTCTTHGPSEMNISPIRALSVKITQVQAP